MTRAFFVLFLVVFLCTACATGTSPTATTITMIGTNDVHGQLLPDDNRGGLTSISAYVQAVRAARAADGGHVLLIDAGDMWQGTLESNLTEGASVVAAFNALGYDAVAVGNHEFDFGPVGPKAIPSSPDDDRRGALKERAREANFPLLSANLAYKDTGKLVDWPNVKASTMIAVGDYKVGVIGVLTSRALAATIAANVDDLVVLPLAPAIIREATALRAAGANLVIVTAHAGGRCEEFDDPRDLSSCHSDSEIFRVAREVPNGLVQHIFAGHVHEGIAHVVNGISITSALSSTRAFSRVDFVLDNGEVVERRIARPHKGVVAGDYEGVALLPVAAVVEVAE
ncbi:MAG: metallophosphoesterase, partial [Pseudomonadota bacterium]